MIMQTLTDGATGAAQAPSSLRSRRLVQGAEINQARSFTTSRGGKGGESTQHQHHTDSPGIT